MRCGNCKENHSTVDEVRSCYGGGVVAVKERPKPQWPASDKQVAYVIGLQDEREKPEQWTDYSEDDLHGMDKDEVSGLIVMLKSFPRKAGNRAFNEAPDVPAGRYALLEDGRWYFYEAQDGKGRWEGYKFLKLLIGSPGAYQKVPVKRAHRDKVWSLIEHDPDVAMTDYGLQSGVCGRCGSPLTDPQSLARGIGPKCLSKLGWAS